MLSLLSYITFALTLLLPGMASAVDYVPLVGIPGLSNPEDLTLENYINALYILAISIAAFLAVVRLIMAGIKYILTDVVPNKESAKKDIFNSLLGLLIILSAFLILNTINPQLTNLAALSNIDTVSVYIPDYNVVNTGGEETGSTDIIIDNDDPNYEEKISIEVADCMERGDSYEIVMVNNETAVRCSEDNLEVPDENSNMTFVDGALVPDENYSADLTQITFDCVTYLNTECLAFCDEAGGARPNRDREFECTIAVPDEVAAIHCSVDSATCENEEGTSNSETETPPDQTVDDSVFYYESAAECSDALSENPGVFSGCLKREAVVDGILQDVFIPVDNSTQPVTEEEINGALSITIDGTSTTINPNTIYTVNDGAFAGLPPGPHDGFTGTIIGTQDNSIVLQATDGTVLNVGCAFLTPTIPTLCEYKGN